MSQKQLNLGILAHVDAGKTTLTERLLFEAGVIDELGSVDAGTTQTDSLELERRRGITIKSAVASFALGGVHVNLIDTPGHPDFIAEVERVLNVLDGAVLVVSAVEGVQPQTRILMRALQRLRIPTLLFVNKIDRAGADDERTIQAISERLTPAVVRMGRANALGTRAAGFEPFKADGATFRASLAEALAEHDDRILASYVEDDEETPYPQLAAELASQTRQVLVHPVYAGSALTGAGVESLAAGIEELLPSSIGDPAGPPAGLVFKIERDPKGQKIAYVRMLSGTIRTRDRLSFGAHEGKVTAVAVFEHGPAAQRPAVSAGEVAQLWGLGEVQIGDRLGEIGSDAAGHQFPPPTLESVVSARNPDDRADLRVALAQLAEQDPLIDVRQNDALDELSVSLYGEVQQEVIQSTLADEYGIEVEFLEPTPIHIERPFRTGEAAEVLRAATNPFNATIGLRVAPGPVGSGIDFRLEVDAQSAPLYVYKTLASFTEHMAEYVRSTLREGLSGWQVTDCVVTMNRCLYSVPDGPPSRRGPLSTPADFRKLTPLVLMQALHNAGTSVCEPVVRGELEVPAASIGAVTAALGRLGASLETQSLRGDLATIETVLSAARAQELQRELSRLTGGEGVLEASFVGYEPVSGERPTRRRTTANPLNRDQYLQSFARHSHPS
ncbi:MAG TPA: translation factor GTPase family protein [Gaiellaceae bacterium]|nr:translation factor GTPase family protein [Gaiellaceae bacterium]